MGVGKPDCPLCKGEGYFEKSDDGPPYSIKCRCVRELERDRELERIWPGLSRVSVIKETPLSEYLGFNLRATGSKGAIMAHVRRAALLSKRPRDFYVYDDHDLPRAWLGDMKEHEIVDIELAGLDPKAVDLGALIDPPPMLLLFLGVKHNPMITMPRTLWEVVSRRGRLDKPTWVFDTTLDPLLEGHLCYSPDIDNFFAPWDHLVLSEDGVKAGNTGRTAIIDITAHDIAQVPTKKKKGKVEMNLKGSSSTKGTKKQGGKPKNGGGFRKK